MSDNLLNHIQVRVVKERDHASKKKLVAPGWPLSFFYSLLEYYALYYMIDFNLSINNYYYRI